MKQLTKIVVLVLLLVCILALSSCSPQQVVQGTNKQQSTTATETVLTTTTPVTTEEITTTDTISKPTPTTELLQEPVKVYEDKNVIIYFDSLSPEGVVFTVENLTDVNITIQADSISVNKKSINDIMMSDDVAPQSIGEVTAQCKVDSTTPVSTIGGQLRIIDFSEALFDSYNVSFVSIAVGDETIEPTETISKTKVYEDKNVIIYFDSLSPEGVVFTVENLTDVNITIQADSISVNKKSINDIMMSDDVAPQSIGEVTAQCKVDSTTPVSTIGGQLRIIDFSEALFDSYNVSFVNVPVG
jgi:hypothetical protein